MVLPHSQGTKGRIQLFIDRIKEICTLTLLRTLQGPLRARSQAWGQSLCPALPPACHQPYQSWGSDPTSHSLQLCQLPFQVLHKSNQNLCRSPSLKEPIHLCWYRKYGILKNISTAPQWFSLYWVLLLGIFPRN